MNKPQGSSERPASQTTTLLTPTELSALTGISKRAIINASAKGNRYFRAWSRTEEGTWDFEVVNPGSKRPQRRFYRVLANTTPTVTNAPPGR